MENRLVLDRVWLSKSGKVLLENICQEIPFGKLTAIIGPNGSGKTSLLKVIAKLWDVERGSIFYPFDDKNLRSHLAYLPMKSNVEMGFVSKEVTSWGKHSGGVDDKEIEKLASLLDAQELLEKKIDQLSEGEQKRIHLIRVLYQIFPFSAQKVLLLDEPFASLDPKHQLILMRLLKMLAKDHGLRVVIALHHLHLLKDFDFVLALKKGQCVFNASSDSVDIKKLGDLYGLEGDEAKFFI